MSTRLPIARALLEGASLRWTKFESSDSNSEVVPELRGQINSALGASVFFDVQVGNDLYLAHPEKDYQLASSFGPLRLPYPDMWMEWQIGDDSGEIQMAAHVTERAGTDSVQPGEESIAREHFRIRFTTMMRIPDMGWDVNVLRVATYFDVNTDGQYVAGSRKSLIYAEYGSEEEATLARSQPLRYACEEVIATTGLSMSLMNCKNVQTRESGRVNIRRSGADKRRGIPARTLRYHTIVLPGGGSEHHKGMGTHRASAVHRVRGHFKTFNSEAPLLGKHVGTYWWGWQVRGDKDRGLVVSDYKLGAAS